MKEELYHIRNRGIRLSVHWTCFLVIGWLLLAGLLTGTGANGYIWIILFIIALGASIFLHDLAQAIVAILFGIQINGLIITPIGGLPRLSGQPGKRMNELLMLAAGPAVNLSIAGLLIFFLHPYKAYWNEPGNIGEVYPGNFIFQLQVVNLGLGLLNLFPAFPMDGGRALDAILQKKNSAAKAYSIVRLTSILTAVGFLLAGILYMNYILVLIGIFVLLTLRTGRYYHPFNGKARA